MLVSEVIERTYNDWLYTGGVSRPSYDKLTADINASATSFSVTGRNGLVIPPDTILEIGSEQILVDTVSGLNVTVRERGFLETTAAAHTAATENVYVDPVYKRKTLFDTLITIIGLLYPAQVYCRKIDATSLTFNWNQPVLDLPAGGKKLLSISVKSTGTQVLWNPLRPGIDYEELMDFDPPKVALKRGGAQGAVMNIVYQADFTEPTAESDELSGLTNPIPITLQRHLPLAIAGYALQGREPSRVQIEEIRRRLASEGITPGTTLNIGKAMLDIFMGRYVAAERDRLKEKDSVGLTFVRR
jgi:hypothetical protein